MTEVLKDQVTLEVEGIDWMYLNVYVPQLQCEHGVVQFFRILSFAKNRSDDESMP